jgi:hypothetical protein
MVVISIVPFFSLMTLTILLESLQLLPLANKQEPDRARGSFLWQHAVIPTLRFLAFPQRPFRTSAIFAISELGASNFWKISHN